MRTIPVFLLFVLISGATGCRTAKIANPAPLSVLTTQEQTRQAIIHGIASGGWTVQEEKPGEIIAQVIISGKHKAVVGVDYQGGEVAFRYMDSKNLLYNHRSKRIHKNYNKWVNNLRAAVADELTLLQSGGS